VNALSSSLGSGSAIQATYNWNFGDSGSQYNSLVGFNAAHVYDTPGNYTVTLTVTDSNGQSSVATGGVTVLSNSSLTTIYVSPNGSDNNSGTSENSPIRSVAQLNNLINSNERILFQAGGTYDLENSLEINSVSNVEIGSYGSGAQPVLKYDGPAGVQGGIIDVGGNNVSVQGLTFDSIYTNNNDNQAIFSGTVLWGNNITFRDNTFYNVLDDFNMNGEPTNVLVQNNTSPTTNDLSAYFTWIQGNNIVILGNTVANSDGEAILRVGGANNVLIADNDFTRLAVAGTGGKNCLSIQEGNYCYVYGNTLSVGPLSVGPLGIGSNTNGAFSDVVLDSNTLVNNSTILLQPGLDHIMARNNLIEGQGVNDGFTLNGQQVGDGYDWQLQDVYIQNNTVTEPGASGGFLILNNGEAQGIHLDNNLFYAPNFSAGGDNAAFLTNSNNDMNSFVQIKDNVWSLPATISPWVQGGYFFVGSDPSLQSGWVTPAEWEASGLASGDVYENVSLGSTFSTTVDGFTAGSSLPNS
jgi:hypothetical protein